MGKKKQHSKKKAKSNETSATPAKPTTRDNPATDDDGDADIIKTKKPIILKANHGEFNPHDDKSERIVTMASIEAMSDSSSDDNGDDNGGGVMPPEEEWNDEAKALKHVIDSGVFDALVRSQEQKKERKKQQDSNDDDDDEEQEESIEEVELGDNTSSDSGDQDKQEAAPQLENGENNSSNSNSNKLDIEDLTETKKTSKISPDLDTRTVDLKPKAKDAKPRAEEEQKEGEDDHDDASSSSDDSSTSSSSDGAEKLGTKGTKNEESNKQSVLADGARVRDEENEPEGSLAFKNTVTLRALNVVSQELAAVKSKFPWAETFDIVMPNSKPLPFDLNQDDENYVNIHDDLKREVAFYDMALEAVHTAREKCAESKIPFSRPDDFFAEMVKSDDHMAMVKDRLIFETKKMDAVSQRKSNKEQKLRSKETKSNKLAEKAKRKKDHMTAVKEWAESAASNRGRLLDNDQDDIHLQALARSSGEGGNTKRGPNKKRLAADRKYGFGGKKGRFKQTDAQTLNDFSRFKGGRGPMGFGGGGGGNNSAGGRKRSKSSSGAGSERRGKRARDASRSRQRT